MPVLHDTITESTPTPEAEPATIYTYGLNGVSISIDDITAGILWSTIALLFTIIIASRLVRRGHAYIRLLMNLTSTTAQQAYWKHEQSSFWPDLKYRLLYAPLHKKRHHKEIQLSKAVNVGTLPSRLHTSILGIYMVTNIIYCLIIDWTESRAAFTAELRGRTGNLAVVNMTALIVLAGRNNPFIALLHVSFDTFNLFHRWIGRMVVMEAIAHTLAWISNKQAVSGWQGVNGAFNNDPFLQWGLAGTIALAIILFQSPSIVRHAFYETFLHLHQLLAFVVVTSTFAHAKYGNLPQMPYMVAILIFWSYDRLYRLARILYRNISLRRGLTRVTVEALAGEACRVTFDLARPWKFSPGCHVYVYLPTISLWMSHPFSVAWTRARPTPYISLEMEKVSARRLMQEEPDAFRTVTSVSLVMAARSGFTRQLYLKAKASPTGVLHMHGALEGPYGGQESLASYGTVLLFAGGVGITHQIGHVRHLLSLYAEQSCSTRKIMLIWTVRTLEPLNWVRPWIDEILAMPGRREILKIHIFVTRPRSPAEVVSASERVRLIGGRPNCQLVVQKEVRDRVGAMTVGVCGPGALADDVRHAVRVAMREDNPVLDFWEEAFTF